MENLSAQDLVQRQAAVHADLFTAEHKSSMQLNNTVYLRRAYRNLDVIINEVALRWGGDITAVNRFLDETDPGHGLLNTDLFEAYLFFRMFDL